MIKFHPNDDMIRAFVDGTLPSTDALFVSAHCDMCKRCMQNTRNETERAAQMLFCDNTDNSAEILREYVSMFEAITRDATLLDSSVRNQKPRHVELEGRLFLLPPTLSKYADRVGEWSRLLGNLWQAPVDIGGQALAQFIYMENGARVPEHTHKGNEFTLVINGRFVDGERHYQSGDFIALNEKHTHAPTAHQYEGCLVFTLIDEPLHFTSGWAQFVNPLSELYFKFR